MTPSQAATMIGCSASHVRTLIKRGKLIASPIQDTYGYTWDITPNSVELFMDLPRSGRGWPRGKPRSRQVRSR